MATTHADIDHRVGYHPPTVAARALHEYYRRAIGEMCHDVIDMVPDGPEREAALRMLTDGVLAAINAAIARNHADLPDDPDDDTDPGV